MAGWSLPMSAAPTNTIIRGSMMNRNQFFNAISQQRAGRRDRSGLIWLAFLLYQQLRATGVLDRINDGTQTLPTATLSLAATLFGLHFFGLELQRIIPFLPIAPEHLQQQCIQPTIIWRYGHSQWLRTLIAPLFHLDDSHLYYNLISLLWKGIRLEDAIGTRHFVWLSFILTSMTGVIHVVLAMTLHILRINHSFAAECSVGLSGLLFAYKIIINNTPSLASQYETIQGIPVSTKYAQWLELVLIHFIAPDSSFLGHLSGILAGYGYLAMKNYAVRHRLFGGSGAGSRGGAASPARGFRLGDNVTASDYLQNIQRGLSNFWLGASSLIRGSPAAAPAPARYGAGRVGDRASNAASSSSSTAAPNQQTLRQRPSASPQPPPAYTSAAQQAGQYDSQLHQLQGMGFTDRSANLRALQRTDGVVSDAVQLLVDR